MGLQHLHILGSYLPSVVIRQVARNLQHHESIISEKIYAAILFADISGFTTLTEQLAKHGPVGAELLTQILNTYFEKLIVLLNNHGGEVIKFAGDALLALWPVANETQLSEAARRAAQCGVAIQATLKDYQVKTAMPDSIPADLALIDIDTTLSLRVSISVGEVVGVYVGGIFGRWEFLATGLPLVKVGKADLLARPGKVILAPQVAHLTQTFLKGQQLSDGHLQVEQITEALPLQPVQPPPLTAEMEPFLRAYIPGAIKHRLEAGQTEWLAELRHLTVIFINIPNLITPTPQEAQKIMETLQTTLYRYEGSLNKLSVDDKGISFVAAFGLPPLAHEDDPLRGLRTALDIRTDLQEMGVHSAIGLATGQAFCGSVGSSTRREYTMIGDVVNLSARLMQLAIKEKSYDILCDNATYEETKQQFLFETLHNIELKNKGHQTIYRPLRKQRVLLRSQTDMVGRATETAVLQEALTHLSQQQKGTAVVIEGEAGIGKSRLVEHLVTLCDAAQIKILLGNGDAIEKSTPYFAWRPIIQQLFLSHTHQNALALEERISSQLSQPELTELLSLLNPILNVNFPQNQLTQQMDGAARSQNTNLLITHFLTNIGNNQPTVIILDDVHWLDSVSWSLLQRVFEDVPSLLLVIATRPLREPLPLAYQQIVNATATKHLQLEPLPSQQSIKLVCHRLGVANLPPPVSNFIQERAMGHPFFSEELAYALRDAGLIHIDNGQCHVAPNTSNFQNLDFPNSLQGVITSRIDRLTPAQQLTLKVASVIGRIFAYAILYDVHPIDSDKPNLEAHLQILDKLDIAPIEAPMPLTYIFKHIVTQEVAYNLMAFSQRRQLHQRIAQWYEKNNADDLSTIYPLLAHHWSQAENVKEAIFYLEKAGEQAFQNDANQEVVRFFSKAAHLATRTPLAAPTSATNMTKKHFRLARQQRFIGEAKVNLGEFNAANQHLSQALTYLGEPPPTSTRGWVQKLLSEVGQQLRHRLRPQQIRPFAPNQAATQIEVTRASEILGASYVVSGDVLQFFCMLLAGLNVAERIGPNRELALAYADVTNVAGAISWHGAARKYAQLALTTAETVNELATTAVVLSRLGLYDIQLAHWQKATEDFTRALALTDRLGDRRLRAEISSFQSSLHFYQGHLQQCADQCARIEETARRNNHRYFQNWGMRGQAEAHLRMGHFDQANHYAQKTLNFLTTTGLDAIGSELSAHAILGIVYIQAGQLEKARQATETAVNRLRGHTRLESIILVPAIMVAEAALTLFGQAKQDTSLRQMAQDSVKILTQNSRPLVPARPIALIYQAILAHLAGHQRQAQQKWQKGLEQAQTLKMPFEQALARYYLNQTNQTADTFTKLGADAYFHHIQTTLPAI